MEATVNCILSEWPGTRPGVADEESCPAHGPIADCRKGAAEGDGAPPATVASDASMACFSRSRPPVRNATGRFMAANSAATCTRSAPAIPCQQRISPRPLRLRNSLAMSGLELIPSKYSVPLWVRAQGARMARKFFWRG